MSFRRRGAFGIPLGVALVLLAMAGNASAMPPENLLDCSALDRSITKPGGSILAAGTTASGCFADEHGNPPRTQVTLIQLKPDGSVDAGFSDGGAKVLTADHGNVPVELMSADQNKTVIATDYGLMKVNDDGSLDSSFGDGGEVANVRNTLLGSRSITAAAMQDDGKIVVAGGGTYLGVTLARFNANGQLDGSFGGDGVINPVVPEAAVVFDDLGGVAFDDAGRIVLAGLELYGAATMRFLPNGAADPNFGPDHNGFAAASPFSYPHFPVQFGDLFVDGDGQIRIYGIANGGLYYFYDFESRLDGDGNPVGMAPQSYGGGWAGVFAETPGGGLVTTQGPSRMMVSFFTLKKTYPEGSGGFGPVTFNLSPGASRTNSVSYLPADDSLFATGFASGYDCAARCVAKTQMVVARVDAQTGAVDRDFGTGGVVLIPGNACAFGDAATPSGYSPSAWNRCRVKPPEVRAKVKIGHEPSRRPSLGGNVNLSGAQKKPGYLVQRAFIRLPARLKLRAGKAKLRVFAKVTASQPGAFTTSIRGRTIAAVFHPDSLNYDPFGDSDPINGALEIDFGLKRGALRPLARKLRRTPLKFRIRATYSPIDPSWTGPVKPSHWFGNNSTSIVIRARPQSRDRSTSARG